MKGSLGEEPFAGSAQLNSADGRMAFSNLSLTFGQNSLTGDVSLDGALVPTGALEVQLPDLRPLAALVQEEIAGALTGTIRLESAGGVPRAVVEAKTAALSRGDVVARDLAIGATVGNYLAAPIVSGTVTATEVMIGATGIAAVDATFGGDGEGTDFMASATVADIPISATGRAGFADGAVTVELASAEARFRGIAATLAQPSTIVSRAGEATFEDLALSVGEGRIDVNGLVGTSLSLDIAISGLQADVITLFVPGIEATGKLSGTARLTGPATAPAIDATLALDGLSTEGVEAKGLRATLLSDAFDLSKTTGPITIDATAETVGAVNETVASLFAGAVQARVEARVGENEVAIASGRLTSGAQETSLSGTIVRDGSAFNLTVRSDLLSTALPAAARPVLAERTTISGTIARDAGGVISAKSLAVASGDFKASGSASLAGETLDATVEGALGDIARLADGTSGQIGFSAKASGTLDAPDVAVTVSSDKFTAAGRDITGLELTASGVANLANPAAEVMLKGTVAGEALAGSATLKTEEGRREISGLSLSLGANRISGDLALDAAFMPEGTIDLQLPDLGPLAALALEQIEGEVAGKIRFGKAGDVPEIIVDATTTTLTRGDLVASGVSVGASIQNYLAAPTISGKVTAGAVSVGTTKILGVDLTLGRDGVWTSFSGGATVADIPAKASGRAKFVDGTATIELTSGEAVIRGLKAVLARPTTVVSAGGETRLDRAAFSVGGGQVQVTGSVGTALNLDVQLAAMPATVVNNFAPGLGAGGTLSGTARITGAPANPTVGYTLDWKNATTSQTTSAGFGTMTIASSGTFANGRLEMTASAGDSGGLGLKGGGVVNTTGARNLSLDFSGTVPFGFLTRRLAAQGLSLSGGANVSLTVRGAMASPAVGGTIRSTGARFVDARSGIAVNDISAEISLANSVATVNRLTGALSSGGTISGSGTVGIDAGRGFPADLAIKIADGRYTDGEIVTTTLNGDLAIKGALVSLPVLSGTVNLGKTVIRVPDRLPASLSTLNVKHRNAPAAVRRQDQAIRPATSGGGGGGISLDLTVNAPQQIFVQGRGLDAELGGSLKLTGPSSAPSATGQFTLRRGRLALLGKRLVFTRGTLGFSGSLVPYLDFAAEQTATDATLTVLVTGPATNPKFGFASVPALPEDEVLARLIFGRSMSNLSPLQIAQLADAAATLAGAGGSTGLLSTLRGKLGVDDLDVTTDERGRASVSVGKYLNERTYVTIEKGEGSGTGKAKIDLNLGRGVKLRGEAADDGKAKGGIFYEREY
ncbi:MAG TPA: translocation/assembly module TamB domain-containing protein [Rhizobiaceae bacterium]|nr:translocation/assembly module TamB domain-containing protein [Rhizobiaceae bacterium]